MTQLVAANRPWWRSPLLWLAAACLAAIYLFAKFASEVSELETGTFDRAVRAWVIGHRPVWALAVFRVVTWLGDIRVLASGAAIVALTLVRRGARKRPLVVAIAPFVLSLIVYLLKELYRIDRPPAGLASALTFSFPSGHTSGSTAVALVIGYVLVREGIAQPLGWLVGILIPLAVGLSRIFLDMHWASDVVGGWMIGSAYAAGVCALYELTRRRTRNGGRSG